jgi:hypothetical protein
MHPPPEYIAYGRERAVTSHDLRLQPATGQTGAPGRPVVDVAITAHRYATFVREAVESVLEQSYDRWQLTICESGPGGGEIEAAVQPYLSDPRVSYAPSGGDLPLADNWTRAIRTGTGTYVTILNDDDRWHADFLGARVDVLEAHPDCGFAFAGWVLVDEHGRERSLAPLPFEEGVLQQMQLARRFVESNPIVGCTSLVRRSAYDAVGPAFDPSWLYCDWEMWARLVARSPAYYLARRDSDFRRHARANSYVSRQEPERLLAMVDHVERLFEGHVDGFALSSRERARNRSQILLRAALNAQHGGGWRAAGPLYRRAVRTYPPTAASYVALSMIAKSVLGERLSRLVSRGLRAARVRRSTAPTA